MEVGLGPGEFRRLRGQDQVRVTELRREVRRLAKGLLALRARTTEAKVLDGQSVRLKVAEDRLDALLLLLSAGLAANGV